MTTPITVNRVSRARVLAERIHSGQMEKGEERPYVTHLLRVQHTVQAHAGTEDQMIAALLHDAVEDGGPVWWTEIERFGTLVTAIVAACSDAQPGPGEDKEPWLGRKQAHIDRLRDRALEKPEQVTVTGWPHEVPLETYLVVAADKLDAIGRTIAAIERDGNVNVVWEVFKGGRKGTVWYYRSMADAVVAHLPGNPLASRLAERTSTLATLADVDHIPLDELLEEAKADDWPVGIRDGQA